MRRRLGHTSTSVDKETFIQLGQWDSFIETRPELKLLPPILSEVQKCAASGNSSAYCSETARLASSTGASMIAGCAIRAAQSVGPDGLAHPENAIDGECIHHKYPPVRGQAAAAATAPGMPLLPARVSAGKDGKGGGDGG
jgi:hypothetical protein